MTTRLVGLVFVLAMFLVTGCPDRAPGGGEDDTGQGPVDVASSDATDAESDTGSTDTGEPSDTTTDTAVSDTGDDVGDVQDTAAVDDGDAADSAVDPDTSRDTAGADTADGDAGAGQCGGSQGLTCGGDAWCDYPNNSCGESDQLGKCRERPGGCNEQYDPVCGCDGKTYSNACKAAAAGTDVASEGACSSGCTASGSSCKSDQYCDYPQNSCGENGASGTCKAQPQACPSVYDPVCGCDQMTYSNECVAHSKGVDIASEGKCNSGGGDCGGTTCTSSQYCDYDTQMACSGSGTCKKRPQLCPSVFDPVCGCDGNTYSNECKAHAQGVSVASTGKCSP